MPRKESTAAAAHQDHAQARRERDAREHLRGLGAGAPPAPPWRPASLPPSAVDLVQYAVWRSAELTAEDIRSALVLLPAAQDELDALESGLLFAARGAGLTWVQIADAMGFNSPQACQQHYHRLSTRQGDDG